MIALDIDADDLCRIDVKLANSRHVVRKRCSGSSVYLRATGFQTVRTYTRMYV
jgi:hypothetical protein